MCLQATTTQLDVEILLERAVDHRACVLETPLCLKRQGPRLECSGIQADCKETTVDSQI